MSMRPEEIRSIVTDNPHRPVMLYLTSGRNVLVQGLDYVFFPPTSQTIIVALADGGFAILGCATISEMRTQSRSRKKPQR